MDDEFVNIYADQVLVLKEMSESSFISEETCPDCNGRLSTILYGLIRRPQEVFKSGEYVDGGCFITGNDPNWRCYDCGLRIWWKRRVQRTCTNCKTMSLVDADIPYACNSCGGNEAINYAEQRKKDKELGLPAFMRRSAN